MSAKARFIPMPARHWTSLAKELHKELRDALIEGSSSADLLKRGCRVFCHDDLLLVTSWLQVKNLVRVLVDIMPGEIPTLLETFKNEIVASEDVSDEIKEFNIRNLRNEKVAEILKECGVSIEIEWVDDDSEWESKIVAGQTFWLKK